MEPEDLDLSWLPEKPSEDATEPVQLALVAEVDKVTTGKLGEKERELLLSATADNIKTRILTHTMKSMLMVRSGKGRRIAGIAHYADWKTLNVEHPIVAAAIRNLSDEHRVLMAAMLAYQLLEMIHPDYREKEEKTRTRDFSKVDVRFGAQIDIPEGFDVTLKEMHDAIIHRTWGIGDSAEEE